MGGEFTNYSFWLTFPAVNLRGYVSLEIWIFKNKFD